jgi:transcription elongation factor GreA
MITSLWEANIERKDSLKPMPETHLSQETYDRLTAELHELTTVGRTRIAQAIEAARNLGDLSENGDYHAAKDEQGRMEGRIRQLQAMLKEVQIVENEGPSDEVKIGSVVTLDFGFGPENYLVGVLEEAKGRDDIEDVLTPESPLGQALIGQKPGDVEYEANGRQMTVKILEIS